MHACMHSSPHVYDMSALRYVTWHVCKISMYVCVHVYVSVSVFLLVFLVPQNQTECDCWTSPEAPGKITAYLRATPYSDTKTMDSTWQQVRGRIPVGKHDSHDRDKQPKTSTPTTEVSIRGQALQLHKTSADKHFPSTAESERKRTSKQWPLVDYKWVCYHP